MDFFAKATDINTFKSDCLILPVFAEGGLVSDVAAFDDSNGKAIQKFLKLKDFALKAGKCAWLPTVSKTHSRILLACFGKSAAKAGAAELKSTALAIANGIKGKNVKHAALLLPTFGELSEQAAATHIAEAFETAVYLYSETKTQNVEPSQLKKLTVITSQKATAKLTAGLKNGKALGLGVNTARQLGNLPGNICTPTFLANEAKKLGKETQFTVKVLNEAQMKKLGMGSFLSVSHGSEEEGKLIVMEYKGASKSTAPHVLVGKGITFDTGGISLKPGAAMDEMKFDMCGAASVMGVMHVLKTLKPKINVVGVIAAAENMPSGRATKPGDIVTSMSGQTIEILNTDAEGRLVLCDALTYVEQYKPKSVVDIATLTGACIIALGSVPSGLFANDQALADKLLESGQKAQDKAWQLPLWDEYQKQLDSNFADIANIGGREAGSVTAACFLSRFTKSYKWAHLDVAGTASKSGSQKGATGRPVGLLTQYLLGLYD